MFFLGLIVAVLGMLCLALSQKKQARVLVTRLPAAATRLGLRLLGALCLVASAALGVMTYGLGVGLTTFFGWACAAGWVIALTIAWRRRV